MPNESAAQAPPSDINAELCVLSAILNDAACVPKVMVELHRDDFYHARNRYIYDAMYSLYSGGTEIDIVTVLDKLRETQTLDKAGGAAEINDIIDFVVSGANVEYHMAILKRKSILRSALLQAKLIQEKIYHSCDPEEITEHADTIVRAITGIQTQSSKNLNTIMEESLALFVQYIDGKAPSKIRIGWSRHDRLLGGLGPGQLIIIGARPGMGKTQYAINLARKIGCAGETVYIKSYEMSRHELADRFINMNSSGPVYMSQEKDKNVADIDVEAVMRTYDLTFDQMSNTNIVIDEYPGDDSVQLRSKLLQKKATSGLGLVIVDYLQLMPKNAAQLRMQDPMGEISRSLKSLAKELQVPVIALSQLNRESSKRVDKRPRLDDLRESGAIEQDADVVGFLYRDDYYTDESDSHGVMEIIFAKNRHGSTGMIKVFYDRRNGLMAEVDDWR